MNQIEKVRKICSELNVSISRLEKDLGFANGYLNPKKAKSISYVRLKAIADYLEVPLSVITGEADNLPTPTLTEDTVAFPVIGGVAAGYDHIAYEDWTGDSIEIPRSYLHGREPKDFFVLRVVGDSMYPDYQSGDHVLVLRQSTMDRSGQIGVVIYASENATLKRVEYVSGEDWMTLRPINPQYPPITIRGEDLERCTVLGVTKMVIRELEN